MTELKTIKAQVEDILERHPLARESDRVLIALLYAKHYGVTNESFMSVLLKGEADNGKKLPSFESIRRARQKLTAEREDLRGSKAVEQARYEMQEEYIAFARGE